MKRLAITLLIAAALISGCARPKAQSDVLIYAMKSEPITLNPVMASEISSKTVNSVIFSSLVKYDENLEIVPDLAERWESDASGRVWIFHLRRDARWHDGEPFTSEDVEFTFDRLFDPATNTFNRGMFMANGKKPEVRADGPHRVKITLPSPFAPFISNLPSLGIIPKHILIGKDINRNEFNWNPVGTGPFRFAKWSSGEKIYVKANEDYYGGRPLLKGIMFTIIPSSESRRIALLTGCADIGEVTSEDLRALEGSPILDIHRWDQYLYFYLGFDLTNPLFQDRKLRKAINLSIDKESIIRAVYKKNATRAKGPIPPASPYYRNDLDGYPADYERAKGLLEDSGWKTGPDGVRAKDGKRLSFETIYASSSTDTEKAAVFMQAQLKKSGIEMRLKSMEFSSLIDRCYPGKFQSLIFNWSEEMDPDEFTVWHSSQRGDDGMNFMGYSNAEADALLEKGRTTYKKEERLRIYGRFQEIVVDDSPYVFLWTPKGIAATNKRVKGLSRPGPAGLLINSERITIKEGSDEKP